MNNNNFPTHLIEKMYNKFFIKFRFQIPTIITLNPSPSSDQPSLIAITQFESISFKHSKILRKFNFLLPLKTRNNLHFHLIRYKDSLKPLSGVYSINCSNCTATYVGQSGRMDILEILEIKRLL